MWDRESSAIFLELERLGVQAWPEHSDGGDGTKIVLQPASRAPQQLKDRIKAKKARLLLAWGWERAARAAFLAAIREQLESRGWETALKSNTLRASDGETFFVVRPKVGAKLMSGRPPE